MLLSILPHDASGAPASPSPSSNSHTHPDPRVEASYHLQSDDFLTSLYPIEGPTESISLRDNHPFDYYPTFPTYGSDCYPVAEDVYFAGPGLDSQLPRLSASGPIFSPPGHSGQPTISTTLVTKSSEQPLSDQKPGVYACKEFSELAECNETFTNRKNLDNHMRDDHNLKAYRCPNDGCAHSSARHDNLESHRKNCKPGKPGKKRINPMPPGSSPDLQPSKRQRRSIRDLQTETSASTPQSQSTETSSLPHNSISETRIGGLATPPSDQDVPKPSIDDNDAPPPSDEGSGNFNLTQAEVITKLENTIKTLEAEISTRKALEAELERVKNERDDAVIECMVWKEKVLNQLRSRKK